MKTLFRLSSLVFVLSLFFIFKGQAMVIAEAWAKNKALKSMLQEVRSNVTSSDQEIKAIIQEIKSKSPLSIEEESLVQELQLLLKQREILRLSGAQNS